MWWQRMCWNHLLQDSDEQIVQHCRHNMIQLSTPLVLLSPKVPASLVPMLFSLASCWGKTESSRPGGGGRCGVTCTPHSSLSHLWNMKVNGGCYPGIGERKVGKHQPVNPQFLLVINNCYRLSLPNPEFLIQKQSGKCLVIVACYFLDPCLQDRSSRLVFNSFKVHLRWLHCNGRWQRCWRGQRRNVGESW